MTVRLGELAEKILGWAQGAIMEGTENADPLIRGYLRQAVEHGAINSEKREEVLSFWQNLRKDIDRRCSRGVIEADLSYLRDCLGDLQAARS